jgi:hypothetical protein
MIESATRFNEERPINWLRKIDRRVPLLDHVVALAAQQLISARGRLLREPLQTSSWQSALFTTSRLVNTPPRVQARNITSLLPNPSANLANPNSYNPAQSCALLTL